MAEVGGRWTTTGSSSDYRVRGGSGVINVPPGNSGSAFLNKTSRETADLSATVEINRPGSSVVVLGRKVEADDYRAIAKLTSGRNVSVSLASRQAGETVLLSNTVRLLGSYRAGEEIKIRMQVFGVNPTLIRTKVWRGSEVEPQAWSVTAHRTGLTGCSAAEWSEWGVTSQLGARSPPAVSAGFRDASGDRVSDATRGNAMTAMTEFTRLTVIGSARKADLVVPNDEAVAGLMPRLMDLLDEPTGSVVRPLTLVRTTGEQLDAALTIADQQVSDGELLRLVRSDDAPPPPEVADVTDVLGESLRDRAGLWSRFTRELTGSVAIGVLSCALAAQLSAGPLPLVVAVVVLSLTSAIVGRASLRWICVAGTAAGLAVAANAAWQFSSASTLRHRFGSQPSSWDSLSSAGYVSVSALGRGCVLGQPGSAVWLASRSQHCR